MIHLQIQHVTPGRVWGFIYDQLELGSEEQRHLNLCVECADVFRMCVTRDSLECVLQELAEYSDAVEAA